MTGKAFTVHGGAFKAKDEGIARHIVSPGVDFTVAPDGKTACFATTGLKFPMNGGGPDASSEPRKVVMFCGEIDGVRCHVSQRAGKVRVILTRRELKP